MVAFTVLLVLPIGITLAYETYFTQFNPSSGCGCHPSTNPESATGYIALSSSSGINVTPGETFTLECQVLLFIEAGDETVTIGFLAAVDDNSEFTFNATQKDGIDVNSTGNTTLVWFSATAPSISAPYVITPYAVEGYNGNTKVLNWAEGSITINVVAMVSQATTLTELTKSGLDVTLTWGSVENATIYYIYRDSNPISDIGALTPIASTSSTTYVDTVPDEGNYSYAIVAGNY